MVSVPNQSHESREIAPSPFCPSSVHLRGVLTLTEAEQWLHLGKMREGEVQRRIFKGSCSVWDREYEHQCGCSSTGTVAVLRISASAAGVVNPAMHTRSPPLQKGLREELMGLAAASPSVLLAIL